MPTNRLQRSQYAVLSSSRHTEKNTCASFVVLCPQERLITTFAKSRGYVACTALRGPVRRDGGAYAAAGSSPLGQVPAATHPAQDGTQNMITSSCARTDHPGLARPAAALPPGRRSGRLRVGRCSVLRCWWLA